MTTQNTVSHEPHTAATVDAEKVRRVLSVREPSKTQDKSAAQATEPKPASR